MGIFGVMKSDPKLQGINGLDASILWMIFERFALKHHALF